MAKSRTRRPQAVDPRADDAPATVAAPPSGGAASRAVDTSEERREPPAVRRRLRDWTPFLLVRAAHPRQAVVTAVALTVAAALDNRPAREMVLVFATVLVGQAILGWHNDIVDQAVDASHERVRKPVADGRLETGTTWFALCCGVLLVVPLAVSNGTWAGIAYLASLIVGMLGNIVLRRGLLSFVPWAIAFALYPAFLSYGGWGGGSHGGPPQWVMVGLAAALGVGVHLLLALWGLVNDNEDGWTYLPLKLGLRLGATKLLLVTSAYCAVVVAALLYAGQQLGLAR